ncbi:hypothetical protein KIS4809_3460 [Bacillus sp. ZZV12-4809]|nr:hypothetical protein KIS4809_3460 [Bacillus sp. ZZV12-4809]
MDSHSQNQPMNVKHGGIDLTHTQSFAWKNADFIAKPNLKEKKVEFIKHIED